MLRSHVLGTWDVLVALAAAERFGEKFVSVCSSVSQHVNQDPPLLLLSALCTSLAFRRTYLAGLASPLCKMSAVQSRIVALPTYVFHNLDQHTSTSALLLVMSAVM